MKCGAVNETFPHVACELEPGHSGRHGAIRPMRGGGEGVYLWHNPGLQATAEEARDVGSESLAAAPEPQC